MVQRLLWENITGQKHKKTLVEKNYRKNGKQKKRNVKGLPRETKPKKIPEIENKKLETQPMETDGKVTGNMKTKKNRKDKRWKELEMETENSFGLFLYFLPLF